jgi:membrane peptidoglycan carboxypeptidase
LEPIKAIIFLKYRRNRQVKGRVYLQRQLFRIGWALGAIISLIVVGIISGVALIYANLTSGLPSPQQLPVMLDAQDGILLKPTRIYDRSGDHLLIALDNGLGTRQFIPLDTSSPNHIPEDLVKATLATADPGFWSEPGFLWTDLTSSHLSTLAENLVSELLLSDESPSLRRNLRVRILAGQVTAIYGRQKILEWYLNSADYGHLAYGVNEAAELYFGIPASQLNLAQAALLAAVAQAPALNPIDAPDAARANEIQVIRSLLANGLITPQQADQANAYPMVIKKSPPAPDNPAAAFTSLVREEAAALVGQVRLDRGGLVIRTTLDYDLQLQLMCTIRTQLLRITTTDPSAILLAGSSGGLADCPASRLLPTISLPGQPKSQNSTNDLAASGLIMDPQTGQILAMLGDTNSNNDESPTVDHHPTGSLITPFIYLAGFSRGWGPATLVWDIPSSLPTTLSDQNNPDGKFHGPVRLRMAMVNDYLAPAAQLLDQIGPDVIWHSAAAFGLPDLGEDKIPFSGGELSIYQVAQAYAILANQGIQAGEKVKNTQTGHDIQPVTITQVRDGSHNILVDWTTPVIRPIITTSLAYLVNQELSDDTARWPSMGSANPLAIGRQSAAKIGQTADELDSWAVGYTSQRLVAIWFGDTTGRINSQLAAGVWHAMIQYTLSELPAVSWSMPAGINTVDVCDPSGLLPTLNCPNVVSELFLTGNEPTSTDNLYQSYAINRETGRLATIFTPPALVIEKTFLVVPLEAHPWAVAAGLPVPPQLYDVIEAPPVLPDVHISSPTLYSAIKGVITITGSAMGDNFAFYQLLIGAGLNPQKWTQIGSTSDRPVNERSLATIDTTQFDDGLYAVRLVVVQKNQEVQTAVTQVTIDNTTPTIKVIYPTVSQVVTFTTGMAVVLQAEATDNLGMNRIEWWVDGKLAGARTQAPYSLPWDPILGSHSLVVKAYDRAGNQTNSEVITFTVK